jgi:hypothetical protein
MGFRPRKKILTNLLLSSFYPRQMSLHCFRQHGFKGRDICDDLYSTLQDHRNLRRGVREDIERREVSPLSRDFGGSNLSLTPPRNPFTVGSSYQGIAIRV